MLCFSSCAVPGAAPNILGVTADQTQPSVTVTWEPLDAMFHYDSGLTAYRVHYIAADPMASKYEGTMDTTTGTATSLTLNLLDEGTAYTISVAAVNSEGLGPYSRGRPVITSGQRKSFLCVCVCVCVCVYACVWGGK